MVMEMEYEQSHVSGECRIGASGMYFQLCHIAEGMQHGHQRRGTEQEGQHITETQVVIDVADQHQQQHEDEAYALPRGDDEDAALVKRDRSALNFRAEQPSAKLLFECGKHVSDR